jgi:pSer/pThr/pTyr-binding forkhead associated (FHA) protein
MIAPDRDYFNGNQADSAEAITYPEGLLPREVPLTGDEIIVGRSDEARGSFPDIDLSRPVADQGVSRRHAVLHRQGDGSWALTDEDSANGTWLNDDPEPLQGGKLVALHDGDRIQMGAFTVLILRHHPDGTS